MPMNKHLNNLPNTHIYYDSEVTCPESIRGLYRQTQVVASITKSIRGIDMHSCASSCLLFDDQTPSGAQSLSAPCHPPTDCRKSNDFHLSCMVLYIFKEVSKGP